MRTLFLTGALVCVRLRTYPGEHQLLGATIELPPTSGPRALRVVDEWRAQLIAERLLEDGTLRDADVAGGAYVLRKPPRGSELEPRGGITAQLYAIEWRLIAEICARDCVQCSERECNEVVTAMMAIGCGITLEQQVAPETINLRMMEDLYVAIAQRISSKRELSSRNTPAVRAAHRPKINPPAPGTARARRAPGRERQIARAASSPGAGRAARAPAGPSGRSRSHRRARRSAPSAKRREARTSLITGRPVCEKV